jgi:FlaA1/EpsC-like NDP-sugar epimerase
MFPHKGISDKSKESLYFVVNILKSLHPILTYYLTIYILHIETTPEETLFFISSLIIFRALTGLITKFYKLSYKFASVEELAVIAMTTITGSILCYVLSSVTVYAVYESLLLIELMFSIFLISFIHISNRFFKLIRYHTSKNSLHKNILIIGNGLKTSLFVREIKASNQQYNIIGTVTTKNNESMQHIHGIRALGSIKDLNQLLKNYHTDIVVLALDKNDAKILSQTNSICKKLQIKLKILPDVEHNDSSFTINDLRDLSLVDLLDRAEIKIDIKNVSEFINNKTVLVTGAAGSIGAELCRQIASFGPLKLLLLDHAETPLYQIDLELSELYQSQHHKPYVADVRNKKRLLEIFKRESIDIVFHAAAYKHVPLMEYHITEALSTNVEGTKNCADLSAEFLVDKFIFVSTDKAVNPTNIMGCSKRIAELYIQSLEYSSSTKTKYITTRFGNVLGSNGSVIPRFQQQIQTGGPLTVTHPDITRFFMLINEAVSLVLQAAMMGKGKEIFLFDMGESVKIVDLAKKMVSLSGLKINTDIQIEYTGLRPGEKIYEELLIQGENNIQTEHESIVCANSIEFDYKTISEKIDSLLEKKLTLNTPELITRMKDLVDEFEPKNTRQLN